MESNGRFSLFIGYTLEQPVSRCPISTWTENNTHTHTPPIGRDEPGGIFHTRDHLSVQPNCSPPSWWAHHNLLSHPLFQSSKASIVAPKAPLLSLYTVAICGTISTATLVCNKYVSESTCTAAKLMWMGRLRDTLPPPPQFTGCLVVRGFCLTSWEKVREKDSLHSVTW